MNANFDCSKTFANFDCSKNLPIFIVQMYFEYPFNFTSEIEQLTFKKYNYNHCVSLNWLMAYLEFKLDFVMARRLGIG